MFLEISQNSQENICARVSFSIKPFNFIKDEILAQVFSCGFCEIFKNTFFHGTPPVAASKIRKTTLSLLFYFTFTFSFKFSQTSLIIKELIKHENNFNKKVFHDRENSENRFSEFSYIMKGSKSISWTFLGSLHNKTIVKHVFHEMPWKKHFTVYPRLNKSTLKNIFLTTSFSFEYIKGAKNISVKSTSTTILKFVWARKECGIFL